MWKIRKKIGYIFKIYVNFDDAVEQAVWLEHGNRHSAHIHSKNIDNISMNELSMGMTGDYEVAIEEGATYVRVGTGIFGSRQY